MPEHDAERGLPPRARELRVAVVEDQQLYREMLTRLLDEHPRMQVVVQADGARAARREIRPGDVDVAVLDVELTDGNGVGLGIALRRADPGLGILLLSAKDVMELLLDLPADVREGWSYLSKNSALTPRSLVAAIEATAEGRTVLDETLLARSRVRASSPLAVLSRRQLEVLTEVARGLSNQGVAGRLGISARSVENHLGAIYSVLELPSDRNPRVAAVLRLIEDTVRAAG